MVAVISKRGREGRPKDTGAPVPDDVLADPAATVAAYTSHLQRTGLAEGSIRVYLSHARAFATWLAQQPGHTPVDTFTDPFSRDFAMRDYRQHLTIDRRLLPATVDSALNAVDTLFEWVGLGRSATGRVNASGGALGEGAHLTREQSKAVLREAERRGARDLAIIGLMRFAGPRVNEVHLLNVDDVWVSERKGAVQLHGKGAKVRTVPLGAEARDVLGRWLRERRAMPDTGEPALFVTAAGNRLAVRSLFHTVSVVGKAAGIEGLHPHTLRHTFARRLLEAGVPIRDVQEYLGHASVATTQRYTKPSAEEAAANIERGGETW